MQIVILLALALSSFVLSKICLTQIIQKATELKERRKKINLLYIAFWLVLLVTYAYLLFGLDRTTRTVSLITFGTGFLVSFKCWPFASFDSMAKREMKKVIFVSAKEHTSTYKDAFRDFLRSVSPEEAFADEDIDAAQQHALEQYYQAIAVEVFTMTEVYSRLSAERLRRTFEYPQACGYEITLSDEKPYALSGELYAMSFFAFTQKKADINDCKELDALTMAHIERTNMELAMHKNCIGLQR